MRKKRIQTQLSTVAPVGVSVIRRKPKGGGSSHRTTWVDRKNPVKPGNDKSDTVSQPKSTQFKVMSSITLFPGGK